eukprot:269663-Prymnesium_polylepis.1
MSWAGIEKEIGELGTKAKTGALTVEDMGEGGPTARACEKDPTHRARLCERVNPLRALVRGAAPSARFCGKAAPVRTARAASMRLKELRPRASPRHPPPCAPSPARVWACRRSGWHLLHHQRRRLWFAAIDANHQPAP